MPHPAEGDDRSFLASNVSNVRGDVRLSEQVGERATKRRVGAHRRASARSSQAFGRAAFAGEERPTGHIACDRGWLNHVARGWPEQLAVIPVAGDSMAPTLGDGDDILVDRGVRIDDALVVKRLALDGDRAAVTILSGNPIWADLPPRPASELDVIGRLA